MPSLTPEASFYYDLGLREYPGIFGDAHSIVPTVPGARQLTAEMVYVYEHRMIANWFVYIERFEYFPESDSYIFVHYARNTA